MSNENIVYSNELVVRFEQDAEGAVNWIVKPDAAVDSTSHATLDELARAGAPPTNLSPSVPGFCGRRDPAAICFSSKPKIWTEITYKFKRQTPIFTDLWLAHI